MVAIKGALSPMAGSRNKADAKKACELLNAGTIGGKKGTYYHDGVWNLLYLKGFKWHNLTEQIAAESAERASRMRAEISKTTKENKEFVQNVERAKMLEGMESKKAAKRANENGEGANGEVSETGQVCIKEGRRTGPTLQADCSGSKEKGCRSASQEGFK